MMCLIVTRCIAYVLAHSLLQPAVSLNSAHHGVSKTSGASQHDCYSPYEGRPLLHFTRCTPAVADQVYSLLVDGSCLCLGEGGELLAPRRECCFHAPAVCHADAAAKITGTFAELITVVHNDTAEYFRNSSGSTRRFAAEASAGFATGAPDFFKHWRDIDDQRAHLRESVGAAASVAKETANPRMVTIGKSVEGRDIQAVRFTGRNFTSGKGLKMLLQFQTHAREWISGMAGVYIVEQIAKKLRQNPEWLNDDEIVVIPMVNPDGFIYSGKEDRLWRKNMRDNGSNRTVMNCNGVDLNRNFPTDWNGTGSTSTDICSEVFVGPAAASEPETQAVMSVIDEGNVDLHLDYHSYSELIMAPWSYTAERHPDRRKINKLMSTMRTAIRHASGKQFATGGSDILYPASGIGPDYSTEKGGWGLTVELSPSNVWFTGGFMLPETDIRDTVELTYASVIAAYDWMKRDH